MSSMSSVLGSVPAAGWGGILLAVGALLVFLRIFARAAAVMAFAGVCLLGRGMISSLLAKGAGTVTGKLFGAAVPVLIVVGLGVILANDLHKRGTGRPGKKTFFVALALGAFLVAGVSQVPALKHVPHSVRTTVTSVTGR